MDRIRDKENQNSRVYFARFKGREGEQTLNKLNRAVKERCTKASSIAVLRTQFGLEPHYS